MRNIGRIFWLIALVALSGVFPGRSPDLIAQATGTGPVMEERVVYRIQVGAFRDPRNARNVFDRLTNAGLSPAFEQYEDLTRVLLINIREEEIATVIQILDNLGFRDRIVRLETQVQTVPPAPAAQVTKVEPVRLTGAIPEPGRLYRLRVGSYIVPVDAINTFERLRNAGLSPAYERYEGFYRVVLPNIRASDISFITQTLGNLGFQEAFVQIENPSRW